MCVLRNPVFFITNQFFSITTGKNKQLRIVFVNCEIVTQTVNLKDEIL